MLSHPHRAPVAAVPITLSRNEISLGLRKAAIGAGWPLGAAEEIGRAAVWLSARGHDGVAAALAALAAPPSTAAIEHSAQGLVIAKARAAAAGPSVFDVLAAHAAERIVLRHVDAPLLLVGFAGVAASDYGGGFMVSTPEGAQVAVSAAGAAFSGPALSADQILVEPLATPPVSEWPAVVACAVDPSLWERVLTLAARTYVPTSDASRRRGAGAGLTDCD